MDAGKASVTHGGKREGSGKPRANLNERRVMVLVSEGLTRKEIAERMGCGIGCVVGVINRSKAAQCP